MLNIELVYSLYEGLSPERKEELRDRLFKKSRQTMAYFKRSKDISLSKLKVMADFYQMPLDRFRLNSNMNSDKLATTGQCFSKCSTVEELQNECSTLKNKIRGLEHEMDVLKATLTSKEETNLVLKELVESLKNQLNTTKQ